MMGSNANHKAPKPADFSDIQLQIKRNAEEYRDFLSDLSSWQKEMKTKDAKAKIPPVHSSNQPPIRTGSKIQPRQHVPPSTRSTELTDLKSQTSESKRERKISGFDYNSWDKFDVDKALEDLENQEYQEYHDQKSKQKVSDQSLPPQSLIENKEMAKIEKDEGNVYFKKGKFVKAVQHYTKAIEYDSECAVYYLNRAMALLKLQRFSEAETDCTRGLEREPKNIKALWRRANARIGLGKLKEAKQDLEAALVLEPTNKAIKDDLSKLQYKLPAATGVSNNAADIATHEKLGPLRRKLTVEEVEAECDIPEDHPVRLFTSRSNEVEIMKPNITSIDQSMSPPIQESVVASTVPSSVAGTFVPDVPLTSADASIPDTSKSSSSSSPAPSVFPSSTSNSIQEASSSSPNFTVSTKGLINVLPPPPTASFEFERDIKIVQNSTELLYQYLK
ncbi:hypothetical protein BKA69DRAFT_347227 [Paraphysoderma sedebokerense]|nr:hypothetical protein BKA69DRAFT_347227 [Paraphysoderma sedebokerense]